MRRMSSVYDCEAFQKRVNYAAQCIMRNTHSRSFDTCFEMSDGDTVVTALVRRCVNNPKLKAAITLQWGGTFPEGWTETAAKLAHIPTRKLSNEARRERERARVSFERALEAQRIRNAEYEARQQESHP